MKEAIKVVEKKIIELNAERTNIEKSIKDLRKKSDNISQTINELEKLVILAKYPEIKNRKPKSKQIITAPIIPNKGRNLLAVYNDLKESGKLDEEKSQQSAG